MRYLYNLSRLNLNKTLKKIGSVVAGYIFNTAVNPLITTTTGYVYSGSVI